MYKWPQGRVIRTICLLLLLLVVTDLGYNGAYGPLDTWATDGSTKQLVFGLFFAVMALAVLVAGIVAVGFHHLAVDFLIEVEQEMVKVEWPAGNVLVRSTIIIAIATVILAVLILAVDTFNLTLFLTWLPALFGWLAGS
jgi:preprotein translocase SecE subunit